MKRVSKQSIKISELHGSVVKLAFREKNRFDADQFGRNQIMKKQRDDSHIAYEQKAKRRGHLTLR